VRVELPEGTSLTTTDALSRQIEEWLARFPFIATVQANIGRGNPQVYDNTAQANQRANYAEILGALRHYDVHTSPADLVQVRTALADLPDAVITVREFEQGVANGAPKSGGRSSRRAARIEDGSAGASPSRKSSVAPETHCSDQVDHRGFLVSVESCGMKGPWWSALSPTRPKRLEDKPPHPWLSLHYPNLSDFSRGPDSFEETETWTVAPPGGVVESGGRRLRRSQPGRLRLVGGRDDRRPGV